MPLEQLDDTARQILDAASKRFLYYGYCKTTMSEIAKDCNMSTGNLYRFFPSKLDIAETFVRVLRREQMAELREIVDAPDIGACKRLRRFLTLKLKLAYERFHDRPKAYELSQEIMIERPKFAVEWERGENELIGEILIKGNREGVFSVDDIAMTARIIQDAAYRFTTPAVFHEGDYDDLAKEMKAVIAMVLDALKWRAANAS